jgi:hypothetical protein
LRQLTINNTRSRCRARAPQHFAQSCTTGFTPTLADPTILTSLGFNYHKPSAEVDVNVVKGLTWKTAWGYYDYNEKFLPAPVTVRDFQANTATLSLRYDF